MNAPRLLTERGYGPEKVELVRRWFHGEFTPQEYLPIFLRIGDLYNHRPVLGTARVLLQGGWHSKIRPEALIHAGRNLVDGWTVMDRLGQITAPTLVIAGRDDFVFPPECQHELADGIPHARLRIIERAGHNPHAERGAEVMRAVRDFIVTDHPGPTALTGTSDGPFRPRRRPATSTAEREERVMPYQIEVTDTVPGTVFDLRRVVRPEHIGDDIGAGLADLYTEAGAAGLRPAGPPAVTYLDPLIPGRPMNVELGVPVAPGTGHTELSTGARVVARQSGPVARTTHHGGYTGIGEAYQALEEWIFSHGYRSAGPPTETYLVGPDTARDPAQYRTEVSIPVRPSIGLSIRVSDGFAATADRTRKALQQAGFGVLTEIDLQATLRDKIGAEIEDFLILGTCDPRLAKRALDVDRQAGLLLPCTVAVRTEGDTTVVEALDPAVLVRGTTLAGLEPVSAEARARLAAVLASLRTV